MENAKPHAAIVASPGMGHLIPIFELGKRLLTHHGFNVTIFVVATHTSPAESQLIHSDLNLLNIVELPHVDISDLVEPDVAVVTKLAVMMREARPALRTAISSMKSQPTVLIVDLFGTESFGIADEFEMAKYVYIPSAWFLALTTYAPTLDKVVEGEYVDKKEPLQIPGCKPVRPQDVVDPMVDRTNQQYHEYVRIGAEIPMGDGILVNTWEDLEPTTLGALKEDKILSQVVKVPVYPIGPLVRSVGPVGSRRSELLDWLDMQPSESVIYLSFGSGGALSAEQITELAWGLEGSQQRFIWVVRPPIENDASGSFFTAGSGGSDDRPGYLPEGFLTRTREMGLVVPLWAPQGEILGHPSVGGFLSHCGWNSSLESIVNGVPNCGWNSSLESIVNGVPMIAWPLCVEQRLNATMLTEELGVAVRPKEEELTPLKKVVGREEIEMMVRRVMEKEGNRMRDRVKKLQHSAVQATSKDGSSFNYCLEWATKLKISLLLPPCGQFPLL